MSVLELRYAEALLSAAHSPEEANLIGETLCDFSVSYNKDSTLREFFINPIIGLAIKKETVKKIFFSDELKLVSNFLLLLLDKHRFQFLSGITQQYLKLKDVWQKNLEIKIKSALPLSDEQITNITEKYKKQFGAAKAYVTLKIDPKVIGGIHIQIGDIRIDDTQTGRLNALKRSITGIEIL